MKLHRRNIKIDIPYSAGMQQLLKIYEGLAKSFWEEHFMKAKNFTTAALIGIMLLTACNGNNGNAGTIKKPNNPPSSGLINNSTPNNSNGSGNSVSVDSMSEPKPTANSDEYKYKFDSELAGMVIVEYEGEAREVIIPDTLEGFPVVKIDHGAFAGLDVASITIPNSVVKMGDHVFDYCTGLESVTIGSGLTKISVSTFVNCMNLTSITIPSSVTKIGDYAFDNCSSLTDITIPDSVTEIGYDAFVHCESINATYKGTSYNYQHIEDLYKAING